VSEKKVVDQETKQPEITSDREAPGTYADKGAFQHLNRELSATADLLTAATAEWEKATDELAEMEKA
jgi:ATP-binding cassette, subfamily F, member 3